MRPKAQYWRNASLAVLGGGLALGTAGIGGPEPVSGQSSDSVILIVADDLGVDALDRYGVGTLGAQTPTLDRLADDGVTFQNAWAHPMCSPFRAAALTGRHAFRTGVGDVVTNQTPGLPVDEITIPEALDAQPELGAAHAAFGKWHLGNADNGGRLAPNVAGFGHYEGSLGNMGDGPPDLGDLDYYRWRKTTNGQTRLVTSYAPSETISDAAAWLDGRTDPFFLYLAMHLPHGPNHAPPEELHNVDLPAEAPGQGEDARPYYRAMIEAMDTEIGRLLDGLSSEQRMRTTVIFVGDNGTSGQVATGPIPRRRAKGTLYQGGLHVPLIISGPGVAAGGRDVDALAGSVDLFGTVLELMGADRSAWEGSSDSVSLAAYLSHSDQAPLREWVLSEQFTTGTTADHMGKAIRDARYKYIRFDGGTEALFDLESDPYERAELIAAGLNAEAAAALARLRSELDRVLASRLPMTPESPTPTLTATETPTPTTPPAPTLTASPIASASPTTAETASPTGAPATSTPTGAHPAYLPYSAR